MTQEITAPPPDNFDAFIIFEPATQKAANWLYAFFFWFMLLMVGAFCYEIKSSYFKQYPPITFTNALIIHSPFVTDLIFLALVLVFATGFRTLQVNKALRWCGDEPLSFKLRGRTVTPSRYTLVATFTMAGFLLYLLQRYLVASIGGPPTRFYEEAAKFPLAFKAFVFTAVFCAPLVEELLYRGVLFIQSYGPARSVAAIFISTILFTWVHVDQYSSKEGVIHFGAISSVFALGSFCSTLRASTGRVWPSFVVHTTFNFFAALSYIVTVQ